jgi:hypothetical protein
MKLSIIKELLQAEMIWGDEHSDIEVLNACGADLMSDILADTKTNAILLTGLTHRQIIQTTVSYKLRKPHLYQAYNGRTR